MAMRPNGRRVPQVNLLAPPQRMFSWRLPIGFVEVGAIGCAVILLGFVAFVVGLVLGWHPDLSFGL